MVLGILTGFVAGVLAGVFGVGGAVVTTPAVQVLLGAPPVVAVGTPLPVIFPTTVTAAREYARSGNIDFRAVRWMAPSGVAGAVIGAGLTKFVNPHAILLATAVLMGRQAFRVARPKPRAGEGRGRPSEAALAATGLVSGFVSGLLGVGGGVVLVPALSTFLGMRFTQAVGTSLVVIAIMVMPGTVLHAILGHIDWSIFTWLTIGVVPGAFLASRWAIGAGERMLRNLIAAFLLVVAVAYGVLEIRQLLLTL